MTGCSPQPFLADPDVTLYHGDALETLRQLPDGCVDACVTSPPYLDARPEYPSPSPAMFEDIFREMARVVAGPMLLNVGRIFREGREAMWWYDLLVRADWAGWPLTDTLVWIKPNANPIHGPVLASSHEYVFLLGEGFDPDAIRTEYAASSIARLHRGWTNHIAAKNVHSDRHRSPDEINEAGARPRSYVAISTGREKGNPHPAPMAFDLALHLVRLSGGGTILDPFAGSGTTALAARKLGRSSVLIERDEDYCRLAADRLSQLSLLAEAQA